MSVFELLLIMIVSLLVMKPEDIPKILAKIKEIKSFITNIKQEFMSQLDVDNIKLSKKSIAADLEDEMEQMNFYLQKIANLDSEYDGEYSLSLIKDHYRKLVKDRMNDEIKIVIIGCGYAGALVAKKIDTYLHELSLKYLFSEGKLITVRYVINFCLQW